MPLDTAAAYGAADGICERLLELVDRRAERETTGAHHLLDELLLPLVEPGGAEPNPPGGLRHARAGASSTTSSQSFQRSSSP